MDSCNKSELMHLKHKKYLLRFLDILPTSCQSMDTTRLTIAFFAISGLDVLGAIEELSEEKRRNLIDWIYSLQVVNEDENSSGFQLSPTLNSTNNNNQSAPYKWSHIAGTYCALCCLIILGDDLKRVNRSAISKSLRTLQLNNGCYTASIDGTESDMRFLFCAASICYILDDWSGMDVDKAVEFILESISYDFGIAQGPELESHGGSLYCAVATLALTNRLCVLTDRQRKGLIRWLLLRQEDGFQGRPNKPVDTCYSFWVGGALKILDAFDFVNFGDNEVYVLLTQDRVTGGFSKWVESSSDPLHTYLGLAGLSLMGCDGLNEVFPGLNITYRAYRWLRIVQGGWRVN